MEKRSGDRGMGEKRKKIQLKRQLNRYTKPHLTWLGAPVSRCRRHRRHSRSNKSETKTGVEKKRENLPRFIRVCHRRHQDGRRSSVDRPVTSTDRTSAGTV